ncbi:S24 family peptidase [Pseudomonas aeruginosa]|uniref:S24 family peptidase n=1 Tax=Pseudomonas aeruginosa TaxID=287 RepID=UPI003D295239
MVDKVQLDDLGLKYTDPANLKIITGWGQSMLGTIEDKSPILVDVGITDFVEEGVYVFTWLQHLFVKRVQIHDASTTCWCRTTSPSSRRRHAWKTSISKPRCWAPGISESFDRQGHLAEWGFVKRRAWPRPAYMPGAAGVECEKVVMDT